MRRFICLSVILLYMHSSLAQTNESNVNEQLKKYQTASHDTSKISACIELVHHYLFKGYRLESDLDSACIFIKLGQHLANRIKNPNTNITLTALLGNYYIIKGDWKRGKTLCQTALDYHRKNKNYFQEANEWIRLGNSIVDTNRFYAQQKLQSFDNARQLYVRLRLPLKTAETLQYIAVCNARQNRFDTAEHIMRQVISIYRSLDKGKVLDAYDKLADISEYQSDQHKQLKHRLELVRLMESTADTSRAAYHYWKLAVTYGHVKMYNESLATILKALDILKRSKQYDQFYGDLSLAVYVYHQLGKPKAALAFLRQAVKEVPPQNLAHTVDLNQMLGKCYEVMKQYAKAEKYYLHMMKLFRITQNSNLYTTNQQKIIDFVHYYQGMGEFYVIIGEYEKARFYYGEILKLPPNSIRPITLRTVHLMQFKVDSASQNFISAIRHYQRYKQLEDSLFDVAKNQQIQELNIKYETEKQSKDLQLKQQNIVALTSKTKLQQAELKRASLTRNVVIVSAILLVVLTYFGYRVKRKHNLQLQFQQHEINVQNTQLLKLVTEKEWLLKEIHHRVKNNLHTIISLLETQAAFLTDDALAAIQNSQHRVFAMSLIHQKLYQFEHSSSINMAAYLPDLLLYLQDSFDVKSTITFITDIEKVELDIAQAIPIGLIFNEAITNAIKYAFPNDITRKIEIIMKPISDGKVRLSIADNGIGLPTNWEQKTNSSLGLKLMRGLSEDIQATFKIETMHGTRVVIEFEQLLFFKTLQKE